MPRTLSMANFRRKMGLSLKEVRRLHKLGIIDIQRSGFKSDSHYHRKIIVFNKSLIPEPERLYNLKTLEDKQGTTNLKITFVRKGLSIQTVLDFCRNCRHMRVVQAQPTTQVNCDWEYCPDVYEQNGKRMELT